MKPIEVGCTVMIVRWPHACVNKRFPIGKPFKVAALHVRQGRCSRCNQTLNTAAIAEPDGWRRSGGIPIEWLRRIDDPESEQSTEKEHEHVTT